MTNPLISLLFAAIFGGYIVLVLVWIISGSPNKAEPKQTREYTHVKSVCACGRVEMFWITTGTHNFGWRCLKCDNYNTVKIDFDGLNVEMSGNVTAEEVK